MNPHGKNYASRQKLPDSCLNLQILYNSKSADNNKILSLFYYCLQHRKVVCTESGIFLLILVLFVLGNKVNVQLVNGLVSDEKGKINSIMHTWVVIDDVIYDPTPALIPRNNSDVVATSEALLLPTPEFSPKAEEKIKTNSPKNSILSKPEEKIEQKNLDTKSSAGSETKKLPSAELSYTEPQPHRSTLPTSESKFILMPSIKPKGVKIRIKQNYLLDKNRKKILSHLEPLLISLGGQASKTSGHMHTALPITMNIDHRRDAVGLPAFSIRAFPIKFSPFSLISLEFPLYDTSYALITDFSYYHFLLQHLIDKGFQLWVPSQHGLVEANNAVEFLNYAGEMNPVDASDIRKVTAISRFPCRQMQISDWQVVFKEFFEVLKSLLEEQNRIPVQKSGEHKISPLREIPEYTKVITGLFSILDEDKSEISKNLGIDEKHLLPI